MEGMQWTQRERESIWLGGWGRLSTGKTSRRLRFAKWEVLTKQMGEATAGVGEVLQEGTAYT